MKKVCIVTSYALSAVNFRAPLIRALVEKGCSVQVLAPDYTVEILAKLQALGASTESFPIARTGTSPITDLRSLAELRTIFLAFRPDVVLTYFVKPNIWGILAAAWAHVPWRVAMVEGMGYAFTETTNRRRSLKQSLLGWLILRLYQVAFLAAHRVIVLNPDDLHDLTVFCGLHPCKPVLLGGIGVPLDEWPVQPPHVRPLTFSLAARLLREKGVYEFLEAAQIIKSKFPEVRFLLLGGLDESPRSIGVEDLQPYIDNELVEWVGFVEVTSWLAKSSVFVLPSYYREGVPRITQEAMALGRPVITTDVPGCRETVVEGVNGFLVPPREPQKLALAMERFIREPELIETMGGASRRLAEERFDVRRANAKMLEVLGI